MTLTVCGNRGDGGGSREWYVDYNKDTKCRSYCIHVREVVIQYENKWKAFNMKKEGNISIWLSVLPLFLSAMSDLMSLEFPKHMHRSWNFIFSFRIYATPIFLEKFNRTNATITMSQCRVNNLYKGTIPLSFNSLDQGLICMHIGKWPFVDMVQSIIVLK